MPAYNAIRDIADQASAMWFDQDLRDLWGNPVGAANEAAFEVGESHDAPDGPLDMAAYRAAFEAEWQALGHSQIGDSTYTYTLERVSPQGYSEDQRHGQWAFSIRDSSYEGDEPVLSGDVLVAVDPCRTDVQVVFTACAGQPNIRECDATDVTSSRSAAVIAQLAVAGIVLDLIATDWYHAEQDARDEEAARYPGIWYGQN